MAEKTELEKNAAEAEKVYYEDELTPAEKQETTKQTKPKPTKASIKKPYLKISHLEKGDPENELVILEWLDFLLSKNTIGDLIEVLSYYVDLGWISKEVKNHLISYARGFIETTEKSSFSELQLDEKRYNLGSGISKEEESKSPKNLRTKDHIRSLTYILRILKDEIPEKHLERIMERAGVKEDMVEEENPEEENE